MGGPLILNESSAFGRREFSLAGSGVENALERIIGSFPGSRWFVLGFDEPPEALRSTVAMTTTDMPVDNFFRLSPSCGFEQLPFLLTLGIRASRFAPILFWEAFHALAAGGVWLDVDYADRCHGTAVSKRDYPEREYFEGALTLIEDSPIPPYRIRVFRKTSTSRISLSAGDQGWTFGILTAGPSPNAAGMVREILALDFPAVEVIICGPMPEGAPDDRRVRRIDLERPEPRGWITRKKNMIAEAARYLNLCIMHDRFFIPPQFRAAMEHYGNVFGFLTFPQVYFPDRTGETIQRYPDWNVLKWDGDLAKRLRTGVHDGNDFLHLRYDDFLETAYCCGGIYIAKKNLWNLIRQDEALFHCEYEDVNFGLECQRRGIPHRVNPYATIESTAAMPLFTNWVHLLEPSGTVIRRYSRVAAHQRELAQRSPEVFRALLPVTRRTYCTKLVTKFNATPIGARRGRSLSETDFANCETLSQIWNIVHTRIARATPRNRADLFGVFSFVSDMFYNQPGSVLQYWTRDMESILRGMAFPGRSVLGEADAAAPRSAREWLFQMWRKAVALVTQVARKLTRQESTEYPVLTSIVSEYRETEEAYPVIFSPSGDEPNQPTVPNRARLLESPENFRTFFIEHGEGILPQLNSE